jgi:hypothetical protein
MIVGKWVISRIEKQFERERKAGISLCWELSGSDLLSIVIV